MLTLLGCDEQLVWNAPYPASLRKSHTLFSSFASQPKTLDVAKSYDQNEYAFLNAIVEPMLTYDYLKRPYVLVPKTLTAMPEIHYDPHADRTTYRFSIQPNILYQPHPAFARDTQGQYLYHHIDLQYFKRHHITSIKDFKQSGTRALTAQDYMIQIQRLADPSVGSPIAGLLSKHIVGFKNYRQCLKQQGNKTGPDPVKRLSSCTFEGLSQTDSLHFSIQLHGRYPTFRYWLAMSFFSPIPWEVLVFYQQAGMKAHNLSLDWYPVGTGPFYLYENNPSRLIQLNRNPNFRTMAFPSKGSEADRRHGYLAHGGDSVPGVSRMVFTLERESIPRWHKFLQGYYDISGISQDSFDQAINLTPQGKAVLADELRKRGIRLSTTVEPGIFYIGFNMQDPIVGGQSKAHRQLRQAISIAIDYEEYIAIFLNGRGKVSHGPIPPGIFGYRSGKTGMNQQVYQWTKHGAKRRSIAYAKQLLAEAGYPHGVSSRSGQRLRLHFDTYNTGGPEQNAFFTWLRKQGDKLGVEIDIRAVHYNQFQKKMRQGKTQLFNWGWGADYPDPENFLSLFVTHNGQAKYGGVNVANYSDPTYDRWFEQMTLLPDGPERAAVIDKMVGLLREDMPWVWGYHPKQLALRHAWLFPSKPMTFGGDAIRYQKLDPALRFRQQNQWNQADLLPLILLPAGLILIILFVVYHYLQRMRQPRRRLAASTVTRPVKSKEQQ